MKRPDARAPTLETQMNDDRNDATDVTGSVKLALAVVAAGMLFAALGTPLERTSPATTEAATIGEATPATRYEYPAPIEAAAEPHIQAF